MKGHLYAGTMSKVYSEALNYYRDHGDFLSDQLTEWEAELSKVAHRDYTQASLVTKAGADSIFNERENSAEGEWQMCGTVVEASPRAGLIIDVKNAFNQGDEIEIIPFHGTVKKLVAAEIMDIMNRGVLRTRPSTLVKLPFVEGVEAFNLVRQKGKR
jgi:U32 family peptidase